MICKQNHYNNSLSCLLLAENKTNGNQWFLLRFLSVEIPTWSLSAAFTPENLRMDFFWRRFRTCWMQTYFCFNKMINCKMAPSKSHHQVFARTPTQNPKAPDLRPSAQHTLTVLGHGRPCSQKHFTWGHPENCSKTSDLHLSLFVSLQKKNDFILLYHMPYDSIVSRCFYLSNKTLQMLS